MKNHKINPGRTKVIAWAYPTSLLARKLGYFHSGCYVPEILGTGEELPHYHGEGYADRDEAVRVADTDPLLSRHAWNPRATA